MFEYLQWGGGWVAVDFGICLNWQGFSTFVYMLIEVTRQISAVKRTGVCESVT